MKKKAKQKKGSRKHKKLLGLILMGALPPFMLHASPLPSPPPMGTLISFDSFIDPFICKASLVGKGMILTSLHCTIKKNGDSFSNYLYIDANGSPISFADVFDFNVGAKQYPDTIELIKRDQQLLTLRNDGHGIEPSKINMKKIKGVGYYQMHVSERPGLGKGELISCGFTLEDGLMHSSDCYPGQGNSGASIYNMNNEIVGVYSGYIRLKSTGEMFGLVSPLFDWTMVNNANKMR